jgi:hypothetical protein
VEAWFVGGAWFGGSAEASSLMRRPLSPPHHASFLDISCLMGHATGVVVLVMAVVCRRRCRIVCPRTC